LVGFLRGGWRQRAPLGAALLEFVQRLAEQNEHGLVLRTVELLFHDNRPREREHLETRPVDLQPINIH
jgi:hypothetical protein